MSGGIRERGVEVSGVFDVVERRVRGRPDQILRPGQRRDRVRAAVDHEQRTLHPRHHVAQRTVPETVEMEPRHGEIGDGAGLCLAWMTAASSSAGRW